jgi:carbohydrate-selective porin OprB
VPRRLMSLCKTATLIVTVSGLLLVAACPMEAQQTGAPNQTSTQAKFNCRHPANPHRRQYACNDTFFGADEALAGDWNGIRRAAKRIGITPTASYVGVLQTNVTGGQDQVWAYAGQLSVAASIDFSELIKTPGLSAYVGISWGTGSNLSGSLDSTIPTTGLYAPSFYLGEMYLQQKLWQEKLIILAGRLAAANSFAALPVFTNYVNYGINPNPFSLGANDITFLGPPTGTQWGAQATYGITPSIQIAAGAFNTNVKSADGENHGADFTLQEGNKGVLAIAEIDYLRNQRANSTGKPGQITVGFLHSNNSLPSLVSPSQNEGGYSGGYVMGQQMVYRTGGPGSNQGATVWGAWTRNSKDLISPIPGFWGLGLSYEGLLPARKNDTVSAGMVQAQASKYAPSSSTQELFELNYAWSHSRFLVITPHYQYIWKQESGNRRNATVLGVQIALSL